MGQRHGVARGSVVGIGIALASIAGCANAHEADVDGGRLFLVLDAGPRDIGPFFEDHTTYLHDAVVVPVMCGATTCPIGTDCCNPSCGICVTPGTGCVDVLCSDGGTSRRCGGLTGGTCDPTEYCSYPDFAMCGATDAEGVCRPRPGICPPGGATVCGCDGNDYPGECAAYASGTDVARSGPCRPRETRRVSATPSCGPMNAGAVVLEITAGPRAICDASLPSLRISIYGDLSLLPPDRVFQIGPEGDAITCPTGGLPCTTGWTGTVTLHAFMGLGPVVFSYDLVGPAGETATGSHLTAAFWCPGPASCP